MGPVTIGIDVGQIHDPTAIVVAELLEQDTGRMRRTHSYGDGSFTLVPETEVRYEIRHAERLGLGTAYPLVARRLAQVVARVKERDPEARPWVLVDATGVGRPIVDMIEATLGSGILVTAVTFTATDRYIGNPWAKEVRVGKAFLVSRLQALLQTDRIRLPVTEETRQLAQELADYEVRVTERANVVTGAMRAGTHDDLVTALGLAVLDDSPATRRAGYGPAIWA